MFQHFGNRLKRDLKQLVDLRLDSSVLSSGSSVKVGFGRVMEDDNSNLAAFL